MFELAALDLLSSLMPARKGVRLLGISLSNLITQDLPDTRQLSLSWP